MLALTGFAGSVLIVYSLLTDEPRPTRPTGPHPSPTTSPVFTLTSVQPTQPVDLPPDDPSHTGPVVYDVTGAYAFPIAADPGLYTWTHYHWDGSNAVDIEARFGLDYPAFVRATTAPLVAITSGSVENYSGSIGGQGYMLHGDDGLDYYYAHMAEQFVPDGAHVVAGQPLGIIGNSGNSAQFIEPHLHLAIGPCDSLWDHQPAVNGAEHLATLFNLGWQQRSPADVPYAMPEGWPAHHPALTVVTPYDQAAEAGLAQPAIELGFTGSPPDNPLDVIAPLDGEINVIRWTVHYGTRIQITNRAADITVVISGVENWLAQDGDVVHRGQAIGRWNPANRPHLHYMIFQNGVIIDPTPSLDQRTRPAGDVSGQ